MEKWESRWMREVPCGCQAAAPRAPLEICDHEFKVRPSSRLSFPPASSAARPWPRVRRELDLTTVGVLQSDYDPKYGLGS